jgi:branched-chain amino acid aminotransferase
MSAIVNINGRLCNEQEAVVSVFDHGFLYGEGVYEVLRTYTRHPFLLDRHLRRLRRSAAMIQLPIPWTDAEVEARMRDTMTALIARDPGAGDGEFYIRVLLTRGIGELSYDPRACPQPTLVTIVKPLVDVPDGTVERGVRVAMVTIMRNHPHSVNPAIKSNNLLNNALAMQEALRRGAFEAVMLNYRGELSECAQSNLFVVKDGIVATPPLDAGLLAGITREYLLEIGHDAGIPIEERVLRADDLFEADEAFLTGTTREVVPIVTVDDRAIGAGRPGPLTIRLLQEYWRRASELTPAAIRQP